MRLLVLDGSSVYHQLVRRLAPAGIEIESVSTFDRALARLVEDPPAAVIVNLSASDLPWRELKSRCEEHRPPIPVLFESCIYASADEAGIGGMAPTSQFVSKTSSVRELRERIERLCRAASGSHDRGQEETAAGKKGA